jgi:putative acyl-CoA dehydrogenase
LALQAVQLRRHAPQRIFELFCRVRLGPERGLAFGLLPAGVDVDALIGRFRPA